MDTTFYHVSISVLLLLLSWHSIKPIIHIVHHMISLQNIYVKLLPMMGNVSTKCQAWMSTKSNLVYLPVWPHYILFAVLENTHLYSLQIEFNSLKLYSYEYVPWIPTWRVEARVVEAAYIFTLLIAHINNSVLALKKRKVGKAQTKLPIKGIFRDHSHDNALNFHKIRDVCILVMVLDV